MGNAHDELVAKYQKYKEELANYEKELYLYNSKLEGYGKDIVNKVVALKEMGVEIPSLKTVLGENGQLDLTDTTKVKILLEDVFNIYQGKVEEVNKILDERNS